MCIVAELSYIVVRALIREGGCLDIPGSIKLIASLRLAVNAPPVPQVKRVRSEARSK